MAYKTALGTSCFSPNPMNQDNFIERKVCEECNRRAFHMRYPPKCVACALKEALER